ncbi:MAG: ATP-grasp domain-containing protein [bacterium]|nr:ATP-grasp domain-containing protein [bacterium]
MFTIAAAHHQTELALIYVQNASCIPGFSLHQVSTAPTSSSLIPTPLSLTSVSLPSFVINRSRNTILAKWLEERGVRVFNPAIVTDLCNDKRKTYEFLRKHGISFMETAYDIQTVTDWEYPFVVKPACGHGGDLVTLVGSKKELAEHLQKIKERYREHPGYVLQRCASDIGKDLRVYVLGGKIIASVMRSTYDESFLQNLHLTEGSNFTSSIPDHSYIDIRSNYSLGHAAALHTLTDEEETLVQRIIPLLPFDCIGIDFIYDKGHPVFNEIEDAVGARMLYANSNIDLVSLYMNHIDHSMTSGFSVGSK